MGEIKVFNLAGEPLFIGDKITVEVFRGDRGYYRETPDDAGEAFDLVVNTGRIFLARRVGANVTSVMNWMAVGTGTVAAALTDGSTPGLYGEIKRKALSANSANTNNVYTAVTTFGGAAESIQSVAITEAGVFNHVGSGQGDALGRVTFAGVTMADSDLLKITYEVNVGSNTI